MGSSHLGFVIALLLLLHCHSQLDEMVLMGILIINLMFLPVQPPQPHGEGLHGLGRHSKSLSNVVTVIEVVMVIEVLMVTVTMSAIFSHFECQRW